MASMVHRRVVERTLQLGLGLGAVLMVGLGTTGHVLPMLFTRDPAVVAAIGKVRFSFPVLTIP